VGNELNALITRLSARILIVPGKGNSESGHWQSELEARLPNVHRVAQAHWQSPNLASWSERVAIAAGGYPGPVVVIAHSFGCLATAHAMTALAAPISAALLVAPADPDRFAVHPEWLRAPLPGVNLMVVSENDPWLTIARADCLAKMWGAPHSNVGRAGHINVASGYGYWPAVETLVAQLLTAINRQPALGLISPGAQATPLRSEVAANGVISA